MEQSRSPLMGAQRAVGVLLPTREVVATGEDATAVLRVAQAAEGLGFDSVWAGDSVVARPRLDPLSTLGVVAGCTDTITLGTAVLIPALRHPVLLAHVAATLQSLSGGRLVLGVGAGPSYGPTMKEFAAVGVPFETRFSRLIRTMAICQELWTGATVSVSDNHFSIPKAAIAPTPVEIPVWLGSSSARGLREVASRFQGWLPIPASLDDFTITRQRHLLGARAASAAPTTACYLTAGVSDGNKGFNDRARSALERYYAQPWTTIAGLSDTFLGSAEDVASWVRSYIEAGADHIILRLLGADLERQLRALALHLPDLRSPT